jgi:hypothetical protein
VIGTSEKQERTAETRRRGEEEPFAADQERDRVIARDRVIEKAKQNLTAY